MCKSNPRPPPRPLVHTAVTQTMSTAGDVDTNTELSSLNIHLPTMGIFILTIVVLIILGCVVVRYIRSAYARQAEQVVSAHGGHNPPYNSNFRFGGFGLLSFSSFRRPRAPAQFQMYPNLGSSHYGPPQQQQQYH